MRETANRKSQERAQPDTFRLPPHPLGVELRRHFTKQGTDPLETLTWEKRDISLKRGDGSVIFSEKSFEVPATWSRQAGEIAASRYARRAGVPQYDSAGRPVIGPAGDHLTGPETSVREIISRMVKCWRAWGEQYGYFENTQEAQTFQDELSFMLAHQKAAPNSPQWFNTGLSNSYGIQGSAQGHYYVDPATGETRESRDAYSRPQPHACFIQAVSDTLLDEGGIVDLLAREARLLSTATVRKGKSSNTDHATVREQ